MSLSGSVEDLPLLEILQVVSFCQKTGCLTVRAPQGEAGVVFDAGRVVTGYAWDVAPLPPEAPPAGAEREKVVRGRIAGILERLVRLRDGDFAFNLSQEVPLTLAGRDLSGELLPYGINPEELMLDLAKKLDEDSRDAAAALDASFVTPPDGEVGLEELALEEPGDEPVEPPLETLEELVEEQPTVPAAEPAPDQAPVGRTAVLLVDDEPDVRRVVADRLEASGYQVFEAGSVGDARVQMRRLAASGQPLLLVVDVGLPTDAGSSFRGGLDVARHASGLVPAPPVLLMSEAIDERLRARAKRAGASLLAWKPGLSKLDPLQYEADLRAFGDKLVRDLVPRLEGRRDVRKARPRAAPLAPDAGSAAREALVETAIAELGASPDPDMLAFMLLRTARAFFPRVVLLLVRDERLRGLAGYGPVANGTSLDLVARDLSVPLTPSSPLSEAVAYGRVWYGPLPDEGPLQALVERLGRFEAIEAAVVPVRAHHQTLAVVYGDAPEGGRLPDLVPLYYFAEAAGRALDAVVSPRRAQAPLAC